jgi:hypothetical protein
LLNPALPFFCRQNNRFRISVIKNFLPDVWALISQNSKDMKNKIIMIKKHPGSGLMKNHTIRGLLMPRTDLPSIYKITRPLYMFLGKT